MTEIAQKTENEYNISMRKCIAFLSVLIFSLATINLAYAAPCAAIMSIEKTQSEPASQPSCHEKAPEQPKEKCQGLCLCKHVQVNSHAIVPAIEQSHMHTSSKTRVSLERDAYTPSTLPRLERPPIQTV